MESSTVTRRPSRHERRREVAQTMTARRRLQTALRPGGRVWINGREVDGTKPALKHLARSHD